MMVVVFVVIWVFSTGDGFQRRYAQYFFLLLFYAKNAPWEAAKKILPAPILTPAEKKSVLLSTSIERFGVFRMRDFFQWVLGPKKIVFAMTMNLNPLF